jgi:hypothetical protein
MISLINQLIIEMEFYLLLGIKPPSQEEIASISNQYTKDLCFIQNQLKQLKQLKYLMSKNNFKFYGSIMARYYKPKKINYFIFE